MELNLAIFYSHATYVPLAKISLVKNIPYMVDSVSVLKTQYVVVLLLQVLLFKFLIKNVIIYNCCTLIIQDCDSC